MDIDKLKAAFATTSGSMTSEIAKLAVRRGAG